MTCEAEGSL